MQFEELVQAADLARLATQDLQGLAESLGILSRGTRPELVERIWTVVEERPGAKDMLRGVRNRVFAGKTSATWYYVSPDDQGTLQNFANSSVNLSEALRFQVPSSPVLVGAAKGTEGEEYYLRFAYVSGIQREIGTTGGLVSRRRVDLATVRIGPEARLVEIRRPASQAGQIMRVLAEDSGIVPLEIYDFMRPFHGNLERVADELGARLVDTVAKPQFFEELSEELGDAVKTVLDALDRYVEDRQIGALQQDLDNFLGVVGAAPLPFTAYLVAGLERVGLGVSKRDLRGTTLYESLKGRVENVRGFMEVDVVEGGVITTYTIRVGAKSKTIYFMTPASEATIQHVRERLIHL